MSYDCPASFLVETGGFGLYALNLAVGHSELEKSVEVLGNCSLLHTKVDSLKD